jgi:hypothetical protein
MITRGPLLTLERFQTIWMMNLGKYDSLLSAYRDAPAGLVE